MWWTLGLITSCGEPSPLNIGFCCSINFYSEHFCFLKPPLTFLILDSESSSVLRCLIIWEFPSSTWSNSWWAELPLIDSSTFSSGSVMWSSDYKWWSGTLIHIKPGRIALTFQSNLNGYSGSPSFFRRYRGYEPWASLAWRERLSFLILFPQILQNTSHSLNTNILG